MVSNEIIEPRSNVFQAQRRRVYVAGLFDESNYEKWTPSEILEVAVDLINDHEDGWFDDVLDDGTELVLRFADSGCDPRKSLPAYWDLRTNWGAEESKDVDGGCDSRRSAPRLHGIIGCRCSAATAAVARTAGLEVVPMVSPVSSAADLSEKADYPSPFRLVGPDDERGQVGALVSLLRAMEWEKVSVIATDTKFARDMMTDFSSLWVGHHLAGDVGESAWIGEVVYSHIIKLNADGTVNEESVRRVLNGAPTNNPSTNSRVIVLIAHHQHAYSILKIARDVDFQPDTIWTGTEWVGQETLSHHLPQNPIGTGASWMPEIPGYLGILPHRNWDGVYKDFLQRLRASQQSRGRPPVDHLGYEAEMIVDSLLALSMALSNVSPELRDDGQVVMEELFNVKFSGLSGPVSFTAEGGRENPRYSVINWKSNDMSGTPWTEVGEVGVKLDVNSSINISDICWPESLGGCGLEKAPSEVYATSTEGGNQVPAWVWVLISILGAGVLMGGYLGFRFRNELRTRR